MARLVGQLFITSVPCDVSVRHETIAGAQRVTSRSSISPW
jgi:hypothetical protein